MTNASAMTSAVAEPNNQMDVNDPDSESELAIESDEGSSLQAVGILNPMPVEPSIENNDGVDSGDDEAEDDKERSRKRVQHKRTDFMWKYMGVL